MMREINFNEIGTVIFIKSKRARNVCISVRPLKGVKVTVPDYVSFLEAEKIVVRKKDWVIKHLSKVREIEKNHTKFSEGEAFETRSHKLVLNKNDRQNISVRVQNGKIIVSYPFNMNVEAGELQLAIRKGIERALKIEAVEYLPSRVQKLAGKYGLTFQNVTVKNVRTRWGSCSRRKNINLNIHLMRLPDHLIDYVILHELTHTVELNHGKNFWKLLDSFVGNAKMFDKELKNYRVSIY
jgi:predicted metal-dependent hydrolase